LIQIPFILSVSNSGKTLLPEGKVALAQTQPNVGLVPLTNAVSSPIYLPHSRDGSRRLFIVEHPGIIRVILPGGRTPLVTPFLDIRTKVLFDGQGGLLGLTFHPQYKTNGRFFVNYTVVAL
jgi:glucose/sorbosone dehydrogenase